MPDAKVSKLLLALDAISQEVQELLDEGRQFQLIEQKKKRAEQAKRAKEKADREAAKRAEAARKAAALAKRK